MHALLSGPWQEYLAEADTIWTSCSKASAKVLWQTPGGIYIFFALRVLILRLQSSKCAHMHGQHGNMVSWMPTVRHNGWSRCTAIARSIMLDGWNPLYAHRARYNAQWVETVG